MSGAQSCAGGRVFTGHIETRFRHSAWSGPPRTSSRHPDSWLGRSTAQAPQPWIGNRRHGVASDSVHQLALGRQAEVPRHLAVMPLIPQRSVHASNSSGNIHGVRFFVESCCPGPRFVLEYDSIFSEVQLPPIGNEIALLPMDGLLAAPPAGRWTVILKQFKQLGVNHQSIMSISAIS